MRDGVIKSSIQKAAVSSAKYPVLDAVTASSLVSFALGCALTYKVIEPISQENLEKVAEMAACSTGEPHSSVWLRANTGTLVSNTTIMKRLLVDVDVERCKIRQAANANQSDGKPLAFSPGDTHD